MISVIIPTYKRAEMLFYAIEQLYKQKEVELEIIVVNDDFENDPTDKISILYPKVKYIKYSPKVGPGQKHQIGFEIAKGDYVSFPDDDDYLTDPLFYHKAIKQLEEDKSLSFVSGNAFIKYEDEIDPTKQFVKFPLNVSGKYVGMDYLENMFGKYHKPLSSFPTVFRKKTLENNGFMEQIEMSDASIYLLACIGGNVLIIDDYVGVYRVHSRSLTTKRSSPKWIIQVLRQKESIFERVKLELSQPEIWWHRHFMSSYVFFENTSKNRVNKTKILLWGLVHSHGYSSIVKSIVFKLYKVLIWNE